MLRPRCNSSSIPHRHMEHPRRSPDTAPSRQIITTATGGQKSSTPDQVDPQMPAHNSFTRQPVYRKRRRMHEALIGTGDPEGREILLHLPAVVHQGVWVGRPIRVVVDELR